MTTGPLCTPVGRTTTSQAWEPLLPWNLKGGWRGGTEMRLPSASQNGKPGLASPCDYTAHKGLLFLLSEAPTSSWRPGVPGAACESPSVEDPEPDSARRRFPPGYLGKGLAVAPGSRRWGGGGTSLCSLSYHFLQLVRRRRRNDLRGEGIFLPD